MKRCVHVRDADDVQQRHLETVRLVRTVHQEYVVVGFEDPHSVDVGEEQGVEMVISVNLVGRCVTGVVAQTVE